MADRNDFDLDLFFDAAQAQSVEPSVDLMMRIAGDADDQLAGATPISATVTHRRVGIWATVLAVVGGWSAVAGVSTAAIAGLWIGIATPTGVSALTSGYLSGSEETAYVSDYLPSFEMQVAEE